MPRPHWIGNSVSDYISFDRYCSSFEHATRTSRKAVRFGIFTAAHGGISSKLAKFGPKLVKRVYVSWCQGEEPSLHLLSEPATAPTSPTTGTP